MTNEFTWILDLIGTHCLFINSELMKKIVWKMPGHHLPPTLQTETMLFYSISPVVVGHFTPQQELRWSEHTKVIIPHTLGLRDSVRLHWLHEDWPYGLNPDTRSTFASGGCKLSQNHSQGYFQRKSQCEIWTTPSDYMFFPIFFPPILI